MSPRRAPLVGLMLVLAACDTTASAPTLVEPGMSPLAREYVDEVLGVMRANALRRATIDWSALRARVVQRAPLAQTVEQTHPIIADALAALADGHSSYRSTGGRVLFVATRSCAAAFVASPGELPPDVGYVRLSAFSGDLTAATAYATTIQSTIAAADRDSLVGWIVDLRGNGGGNMWPMLAGVGPVLGDDPVAGHFIGGTGAVTPWGYRDGGAFLGSGVLMRLERPYALRRPRPRVAVLTNTSVASSGEAIVAAFRGRPDTRSFGTPTCGLSTSNVPFVLSDGSVLNLTTSIMADRTRAPFGDVIAPDEVVTDPGQTVGRALAWLRQRN